MTYFHDEYSKRIEKYFGEFWDEIKARIWTCGCSMCIFFIMMGEHPEIEIAPEDKEWL